MIEVSLKVNPSTAEEQNKAITNGDKTEGSLSTAVDSVVESYKQILESLKEQLYPLSRVGLPEARKSTGENATLTPRSSSAATHDEKTESKATSTKDQITELTPPGQLGTVPYSPHNLNPRRVMEEFPPYDPTNGAVQCNFSNTDMSRMDLTDKGDTLSRGASFDLYTTWPTALPPGFNPSEIMELGKDPGLGLRDLHQQGITGEGVGIAIIDQSLGLHNEYNQQTKLNERIRDTKDNPAHMHGAAVSSIAVGKNTGVAPKSDLYYVSTDFGFPKRTFLGAAEGIHRLLDINKTLPKDKQIRVISMSVGWRPGEEGYEEMNAAVARAKKEGVFVASTVLNETQGLSLLGLQRDATSDPNKADSYHICPWISAMDPKKILPLAQMGDECLMVPIDGRTVADQSGPNGYRHDGNGGMSWGVPWISGLYALACQVKPEITPQEFWQEAARTGTPLMGEVNGKQVVQGVIPNPKALMAALQEAK